MFRFCGQNSTSQKAWEFSWGLTNYPAVHSSLLFSSLLCHRSVPECPSLLQPPVAAWVKLLQEFWLEGAAPLKGLLFVRDQSVSCLSWACHQQPGKVKRGYFWVLFPTSFSEGLLIFHSQWLAFFSIWLSEGKLETIFFFGMCNKHRAISAQDPGLNHSSDLIYR